MTSLSPVHTYLAEVTSAQWIWGGGLGIPTLQLANHYIHLDLYEDSQSLTLENLVVEGKRGQGVGSQVILALKAYVEEAGKDFFVNQIENPNFFRRFDWLGMEDQDPDFPAQGYYLPGRGVA